MAKHDLRAALLREALQMLQKGEADLSLRAVARAAGVSAMAPYRHFADKNALLSAVAQEGFELLRQEVETADDAADDGQALLRQGLAYVRFANHSPALFRLMFSGACAAPEGEARGGAYELLARRVARIVPGDAENGTLACWAVVHGFATLQLDNSALLAPAQIESALSLFVQGLRNTA